MVDGYLGAWKVTIFLKMIAAQQKSKVRPACCVDLRLAIEAAFEDFWTEQS
jgi:hypothetical protein